MHQIDLNIFYSIKNSNTDLFSDKEDPCLFPLPRLLFMEVLSIHPFIGVIFFDILSTFKTL